MNNLKEGSIIVFIGKILLVIFAVVCFNVIDTMDNYILFSIITATTLTTANSVCYFVELMYKGKSKELILFFTLYMVVSILNISFHSLLAIIIYNLIGVCIFIRGLFNKEIKSNYVIKFSVLIYYVFILFIRRNNV